MAGSASYVAGPALLWVGVPTNAVGLIPPVKTPNELSTGLFGGGSSTEIRGRFLADLLAGKAPKGGRFSSEPPQAQDRSFVLKLFRTVTPVFLGVCEVSPDITFYPAYVPYHRESAGRTHPAERIWDGEEASVTAELTRYNEFVYALVASHAANGILAVPGWPRGQDADGGVGTLVGTEGHGLPLWVVLPYAAKPQFAAAGMPPCYRFYCAALDGHHAGPLSTSPRKLMLSWTCQRLESPLTGAYLLYDHSVQGLPLGQGV